MLNAIFKNIQNEVKCKNEFETEAEANEWIELIKNSGIVGKGERWLPDFLENADTRTVSGGLDKDGNEYFTTEYLHPAEYTYEIIDITAQYEAEQSRQLKLDLGRKARAVCQEALDYVAGYNLVSEFSAEQVTQMATDFASIHQLLMANRPWTAITLIQAINNPVYDELKTELLSILAKVNE